VKLAVKKSRRKKHIVQRVNEHLQNEIYVLLASKHVESVLHNVLTVENKILLRNQLSLIVNVNNAVLYPMPNIVLRAVKNILPLQGLVRNVAKQKHMVHIVKNVLHAIMKNVNKTIISVAIVVIALLLERNIVLFVSQPLNPKVWNKHVTHTGAQIQQHIGIVLHVQLSLKHQEALKFFFFNEQQYDTMLETYELPYQDVTLNNVP